MVALNHGFLHSVIGCHIHIYYYNNHNIFYIDKISFNFFCRNLEILDMKHAV